MDIKSTVDAGSVKSFAKYVEELAKAWEPWKKSMKDAKTDSGDYFPKFGKLTSSETAKQDYSTKVGGWETAATTLHDILTGLKDACDKVAENYETKEALGAADSKKIESTMESEMATDPTQNPPTG